MKNPALGIVFGFGMLAAGVLYAQPAPGAADGNGPKAVEEDAAKQERLALMKREFATFSLYAPGRADHPSASVAEPILRYSNPVRASRSDAAVFLWLRDGRPAAVAAISIRDQGRIGREFASLAAERLECRGAAGESWAPKSAGQAEQTFSDAPAPETSEKSRASQMRRLARRFRIVSKENDAEGRNELRLLSQPIYRYTAEKAGVVDGALFAFVEGTDPEAALVLEAARAEGDSLAWRYTLARLTSRPLEAELDDRPVWSVAAYWSNPRQRDDPYVEMVRSGPK